MPSSSHKPNLLSFQPRARLIRTIGDRLISGPEAAIIELVKNAHDADASFVRIRFEPPLEKNQGAIHIEDDGHGMTLEDIRDKWMEPATSDKRDRRTSPAGRRLLGSKGIGRFAAASLGKKLELTTSAKTQGSSGALETTKIPKIDWDEFETTKYLTDIHIPFETSKTRKGSTGTKLAIHELQSDWTKSSLESLHKEIRRLISPLSEKEADTFKIFLDLTKCTSDSVGFDGASIVNGIIADHEPELNRVRPYSLLKACDYEVDGHFDKHGKFEGDLKIHRGGGQTHKLTMESPIHASKSEAPCGEILVHLAVFDREAEAIDNTIKKAGLGDVGRREARRILDEMCGIAIYRDNFRIRPYGDSDQDWLTLDTRRVQDPSLHIGHNQVAGFVIVDSEERSGLVERSSREGLENNGSFRRLSRLISELLSSRIEPLRQQFREGAGASRKKSKEPLRLAYKTAEFAWTEELIEQIKPAERPRVRQMVAEESSKLKKYLEEAQEHQARLQAQVTLGMILAEVLHEGRAPVAFIQSESKRLAKWLPKLCEQTPKAINRREHEIPDILRGLESSADVLRRLFKLLEPISGRKRGPPKTFNPKDVTADVAQLFDSRIKSVGVDIQIGCAKSHIDAYGYPDDLVAALTNIIDNSLFWLDHHRTKNPSISIYIETAKAAATVDISDNGPGIPSEFHDSIFGVGFTLKPSGTGLGLPIAKEAIERSGGSIVFKPQSVGARFVISLPVPENV
jgi:signal transduction histidine kinase